MTQFISMDVSQELAEHAAKQYVVDVEKPTDASSTVTEERGVPIVIDAGLLAAFDYTPLDEEDYEYVQPGQSMKLTIETTLLQLSQH